jgi:hypothetical protein
MRCACAVGDAAELCRSLNQGRAGALLSPPRRKSNDTPTVGFEPRPHNSQSKSLVSSDRFEVDIHEVLRLPRLVHMAVRRPLPVDNESVGLPDVARGCSAVGTEPW